MRVLEMRHMTGDVILMTWSPKMDLLAIATAKPEVILHRLTWQKVWTLGNNFGRGAESRNDNPISLTFHPEGLYLAIGFENSVMLVEVETGIIITTHEILELSCVYWKSTIYDPSMKEVFANEIERVESNLSILLVGTKYGEVFIYTGAGLLFTVTLRLDNKLINDSDSEFDCRVVAVEVPPDFSSIEVLAIQNFDSDHGNILSLYHFDCSEYAFHGDILGVFAAKAISYKRYLNLIDAELNNLHENWGKIFDVYNHYLSYGTGRRAESIPSDYAELLMTGVGGIEIEMFLGSGGREKEAKKFITALQTATSSFNDNLKSIKYNAISLLRELSDISGYHEYLQIAADVDEPTEGMKIIECLQQLLSLLYHGAVHVQQTANAFLRAFYHFLTLVINTIHTYHVMEAPEILEEEPDPERVFELLKLKVTRNIFEMLEMNPDDIPPFERPTGSDSNTSRCNEESPALPAEDKLSFLDELIPPMSDADLKKFYTVPSTIDIGASVGTNENLVSEWPSIWNFFKKHGFQVKPNYLTRPNSQLNGMLMNFTELAEEQLQSLSDVPLLHKNVPRCNYVLNCFEDEELDFEKYGIIREPSTSRILIYHTGRHRFGKGKPVWLYRLDLLSDPANPVATVALLSFSHVVKAAEFLNNNSLSVLLYAPQTQPMRRPPTNLTEDDEYVPKEIPGQSTLCQIDMTQILDGLRPRSLRIPKNTTFLPNKWTEVSVSVPMDITLPGPIEHEQITQVLPVGNFHPTLMALSGPRRVGALLDTTKKVIQLLDMDSEPENSIDLDTTTGSAASTFAEEAKDVSTVSE